VRLGVSGFDLVGPFLPCATIALCFKYLCRSSAMTRHRRCERAAGFRISSSFIVDPDGRIECARG